MINKNYYQGKRTIALPKVNGRFLLLTLELSSIPSFRCPVIIFHPWVGFTPSFKNRIMIPVSNKETVLYLPLKEDINRVLFLYS